MSTIVGTNIEVTNLKYDSDTTSMIISNAGQVTIQGEGSATTNLQQGLCKAWMNMDGTGTISIRDSFNVASIADRGTGLYTQNISSAMSGTNFACTGDAKDAAGVATGRNRMAICEPDDPTQVLVNTFDTNGNADDCGYVTSITMGDLA